MRWLQHVLAGMPGRWLHHDGQNRNRPPATDLGRAHRATRPSEWSDRLKTLIRNGQIVNANETRHADILIDADKIADISPNLPAESADRIIDATGTYLIPGGIDAHTHLDMPFGGTTSSDDFETGTRAAAFGGTTTIIDFAIQARGTKMRDALDTWWKKADRRACID